MDVLTQALEYAKYGYRVLPVYAPTAGGGCTCGTKACKARGTQGKHPIGRGGAHNGTTDPFRLRDAFRAHPRANLGIATGDGLAVIDVDPRNGGAATLDELLDTHGDFLAGAITAATGGGGRHYMYRADPKRPLPKTLGPGVDVQGDGRFVVAAPSRHKSGGSYRWTIGKPGAPLSDLPAWVYQGGPTKKAPAKASGGATRAPMSTERRAELRSALAEIPADDYHEWIMVGMALHEEDRIEGFGLWDAWSKGSDKYPGTDDLTAKWASFRPETKRQTVSPPTIFELAKRRGWVNVGVAEVECPETSPEARPETRPETAAQQMPEHLLTPPGILGDIVAWTNATARKAQPELAVNAALALGSVVCGRHYRSDQDNYSSMFFLSVAPTACGKEHGRRIINQALDAAGLGALAIGSGYTSPGAIHTAIHSQPIHISIIDEFGDHLHQAQANSGNQLRAANDLLKQAFALVDGTMAPPVYSKMALKEGQDNELHKGVTRPAITLLGMTTPGRLYDNIDRAMVEAGLISRFLVVESLRGHQKTRRFESEPVPPTFVAWAKALVTQSYGAELLISDKLEPAKVLRFTDEAFELTSSLEDSINEACRDELASEVLGRTREKAMRLALILALSDDPKATTIEPRHVQWAADYVLWCDGEMLRHVRERLVDTQFGRLKRDLIEAIRITGARGLTDWQIGRAFAGVKPRDRSEALEDLAKVGQIAKARIKQPGPKREAWVALESAEA